MDYILISESLSNIVKNFIIKPGYRSDHSAYYLETPLKEPRGLWKFNNSLLTNKFYVDNVKEAIERVKIQYEFSDNNVSVVVDDSLFLEVLLNGNKRPFNLVLII